MSYTGIPTYLILCQYMGQAAIGPYFPTLQIFWDFEAMAPLSRPNKTPRIATSSVADCDVTNGRFFRLRRAKIKTAKNVHQ